MVIAHLFLRETKSGVTKLMCATTATEGLDPVYRGVEELFTVHASDCRDRVVEKAKKLILADRPDLEFVSVLKNDTGKDGRQGSFDLTFRPRSTLLDKLGIGKKK